MTFEELLMVLGMETKLNLNEAVASGGCTVQFSKELEVTLEYDQKEERLQIFSTLIPVPPSNRETFFSALLQLHMFGYITSGGVFGYDQKQDEVIFFRTIPLSLMDAPRVLKELENFVNQTERWRGRLLEAATNMTASANLKADGSLSFRV